MSAAAAASAAASDSAAPAVTRAQVLAANYRAVSDATSLLRPGFDAGRLSLVRGLFSAPAAFFQPQPDAAAQAASQKAQAESFFAQVVFPRKLESDAVGELRAKLQLAPRDTAEILALQEYISGKPPQHAVCGHTSPSSCYWRARSQDMTMLNCPFSTCAHGESDLRGVQSCVTGEIQYEEDRWRWMQARDTSSVALAQYHADRLRLIELFRQKRAALLIDIRLLHGAQWPVAFGRLAGVEPLLQSFAALPPVTATPATLDDLAALADHEDAQLTAAEAGSEAYLRADAHARDQAAKRCIFSEFSVGDAEDWSRERAEWDRYWCGPTTTRRAFYLDAICDAGLITDLAALVLAYVEPPHYTEAQPFLKQDITVILGRRAIPESSRVVALAVSVRTDRGATQLALQPEAHSDLLEAIEANPEAKARYAFSPLNQQFVCEFSSPPLMPAGAAYFHEFAFEIPEESGWGALRELGVSGSRPRTPMAVLSVFFVRDENRSKIRVTPNYHALQATKPLQEFREEEIERGWRYCTACAQMWRKDETAGASGGGVCPAANSTDGPCDSRAHTGLSDSQAVFETFYALACRPLDGVQPQGTQADWRRCRACAVLFHGPSAHNSCCPAAAEALGPHSAMDSLEYFVHAGGLCDAPQAARSEPRWRQCRDCSALVRFQGVCPAKASRGAHKLSGRVFAPLIRC